MVTIKTANKYVVNDNNLPVLAEYDGDPNYVLDRLE